MPPALHDRTLPVHRFRVLASTFWDDPAFTSFTLLQGTFALGMCIVNHSPSWDEVRETLEAVERFRRETLSKGDSLP